MLNYSPGLEYVLELCIINNLIMKLEFDLNCVGVQILYVNVCYT